MKSTTMQVKAGMPVVRETASNETVDTAGTAASTGLTPDEQKMLDRLARTAVKYHLTVPAILFLEASKPLSFVGNQLMVFFQPMVGAIYSDPDYDHAMRLLEDRENMEILIRRIEELEVENRREKDRVKQARKRAGDKPEN